MCNRKVFLVNPNRMRPPVIPIALDYLSSALQGRGFEVDVLDLFGRIGTTIYVVLIALTAFSFLVDYLAASLGARRWGASRAGVIGAIVGVWWAS